jgi:hypothetical protein
MIPLRPRLRQAGCLGSCSSRSESKGGTILHFRGKPVHYYQRQRFRRDRPRVEYNILHTLESEPRSLTPTGVDHSSFPYMKSGRRRTGRGRMRYQRAPACSPIGVAIDLTLEPLQEYEKVVMHLQLAGYCMVDLILSSM